MICNFTPAPPEQLIGDQLATEQAWRRCAGGFRDPDCRVRGASAMRMELSIGRVIARMAVRTLRNSRRGLSA